MTILNKYGQIFLKNKKYIKKIINHINPKKKDCIIEIGSGFGALTIPIVKKINFLNVIEIDKNLILKLKNKLKKKTLKKIKFYKIDIIKFNFGLFSKKKKKKIRLFGNLPYNISIKIILNLIKYIGFIKDMNFMLQKEVAERLISKIKCKKYNKLTIFVQYFFKIKFLLNINKKNFYPEPKVDSVFLKFKPYKNKNDILNINFFKKIINNSFIFKRKKLINNLKYITNKNIIRKSKINFSKRAEEISIKKYCKLVKIILKNKY